MLSGFFQNQSQPSTSTSTSMVPTTLPSNTITNPRGEVRAITTRSGLSYTPVPPIPPPLYDVRGNFDERKNRGDQGLVDNSPPSKESSRETKLPYPSRVEREKKDSNDKVQIQKFWEMFKKIHVDITLADALILMPKYQKMLKSLLTNKDKLIEIAKTPMNANCSAVILKKLPEKLGDPDPRVPLILGRPFLRTARVLIDVHGEELVIRDGLEKNRDIIKQKEELKGISDPVARRRACFANLDKTRKSFLMRVSSNNFLAKIDWFITIMSFYTPIGNCDEEKMGQQSEFEKDNVEVNHEVFKSDSENVLGIHDDKEEEIAFLDGLLEDENFFEMNDKKVESFERKTKEVFETKVEPEKKKELQVFHPDIEILNNLETTSYVGSFRIFGASWSNIVEGQSNSYGFIDVSISLHKWENSNLKDWKDKKKQKRSKTDKKREKYKKQRARVRIQPEITAGSARLSLNGLLPRLSKSPKEVLAMEKAARSFEPPLKIFESKRSRDMSKYCHFHEDYVHDTNDCRHLKTHIQEAVKSRQPLHIVKGIKKERTKSSDTPRGENKKEKGTTPAESPMLMENREAHIAKSLAQENTDYGGKEIIFPSIAKVNNAPVIIEAKIFRRKVGRVYMDNESSCEIIYEHCFEKLNPTIKATKVDLKTPLVGFSGERSWSIGEVLLEITIRDAPLSRTETFNFVIIRIVLLADKTDERTKRARKILATNEEWFLSCVNAEEKIIINDKYPDQTVTIEKQLPEHFKKELQNLLRSNADVLA
ncbi:hypothetical protein Tco_0468373 [Tanacetum coccineum]